MQTDALFPECPRIVADAGRQFVLVPWNEADSLRELLARRGCPTTLCLNSETREARLELWPGVSPEAVTAVLEAWKSAPVGGVVPAAVAARAQVPAANAATSDTADLICI